MPCCAFSQPCHPPGYPPGQCPGLGPPEPADPDLASLLSGHVVTCSVPRPRRWDHTPPPHCPQWCPHVGKLRLGDQDMGPQPV